MSHRRWSERELDRALDIVESAELPPELKDRISTVVRESRLTGDALLDVCRELITHFEDGIRAGRAPHDLIRTFGDERTVAALISREKRLAEPDTRDRFVLSVGRGDPPWARLGRHFRYAARRAVQSPGFTLTALLSLAIGIGANTAIFTLVHQVLLDRPPYEDPETLVEIYAQTPEFSFQVLSYPELMQIREATTEAFSDVAGSSLAVVQVEEGGEVGLVPAELVTGNFFQTVGLPAALGRTILPSDERGETAEPVVMLSHAYWQDAYGGAPDVLGRTISLSGRQFTVVGVTPETYDGSFGPIVPRLFAPVLLRPVLEAGSDDVLNDWENHYIFGRGRLQPGATLEHAEVLAANAAATMVELDRWREDFSFDLLPTSDVTLYPPLDRFIRMAAVLFMIVVGLVLMIACANLASFLLARAMDRRREIAVRLALGATRRDLVAQLGSETLLLALLGGALGTALGSAALNVLVSVDLPLPLPLTVDVGLNPAVLLFSFVVSTIAGLLFGIFPAFEAARTDVATTIKNESAGAGRSRSLSLRSLLVAGQVAVSFVLLVGAGLFLRSLQSTLAVDPGFGRDPAGAVFLALPTGAYTDGEGRGFVESLLDELRAAPDLDAVGIASNLHLNTLNTSSRGVTVDGVEPPPGRDDFEVDYAAISPGFLDAVGLALREGRAFTAEDGMDGQGVVIVNQAFADQFWPGQQSVGRRVRVGDEDVTVVGLVATAKIRNLGEAPRPFLYRPFGQDFRQSFHLVARTRGDGHRAALDVVRRARAMDPLIWTWQPRSLESHIGVMLLPMRLGALTIGAFAVLALVLAAVGLYGVVSYAVAQRSREVGIRVSLGAGAGQVVRLLMVTGLRPVALGGVVGLVLAGVGARLLGSLLYGVRPFDPVAFGGVALVFLAVSLLAAYAPARRVTRVSPVQALRID